MAKKKVAKKSSKLTEKAQEKLKQFIESEPEPTKLYTCQDYLNDDLRKGYTYQAIEKDDHYLVDNVKVSKEDFKRVFKEKA